MKTKFQLFQTRLFCAVALGIGSSLSLAAAAEGSADSAPAKTSIPWSQIGTKAGADYQGDGLGVSTTAEGARLGCVFQRLEGQATREGLWLTSTVTNAANDRFRIVAAALGRQSSSSSSSFSSSISTITTTGTVSIDGQTVRFIRPGLVEEYTVSLDGVRQDFLVLERPAGVGELAVRLAVSGAKVEPAAGGARLVLENSGRKIAYSRLRVTDATGKELTARMEVVSGGVRPSSGAAGCDISADLDFTSASVGSDVSAPEDGRTPMLVVVVNDADAVYPVRIDPTFSDANWISMSPSIPGADDQVNAAVMDGSGNLYIGGGFTVVGDVIANHIAKWNGSSWSALGAGVNGRYVLALAVSGSNLYAGGVFATAGGSAATNIAKWDGTNWSALGSGMNDYVWALAVSGSDLYAGGAFTTAGGGAANNIAKWNGSSWSALGSGMSGYGTNTVVQGLAVSGSDLYAGGYFTTAGGGAADAIAKWNGSGWSSLGSGVAPGDSPYVFALAVSGSNVYAGGYFPTAGNIAKWNGSSWSALGLGMADTVYALEVSGGNVYAGGLFQYAGGSGANFIAKWNGSSWSALGSGMNGGVLALVVSGSNVYAGGWFTAAGVSGANYIAKWNGSSWSALGSGMDGGYPTGVSALAVSGSDVYAGGSFTNAGGSAANYIAKWNGSSWSALGSGMGGVAPNSPVVYALAASGGNLYAGGYFLTAGGNAAQFIAKWNGSSWSALGSGVGGTVYALAVWGSNLYAGGGFTTAGGSPALYIAKWNGSSWSALGSEVNGPVNALAVSGSDLYAGGEFTTAGGSDAYVIAKWDGSSWSALGSGLVDGNGYPHVYALAVSGSDLYAGGEFIIAGDVTGNNIAKWNGSSWSALGSGMGGPNADVRALAVAGSDVYAGGNFLTAGGGAANRIAKWDGSSWSALGSGMNNSVLALAVSGTNLYAGGNFTTAGGKVSAFAAKANIGAARGRFSNLAHSPSTGFSYTFLDATPGEPYRIQSTPSPATAPWTDFTNFVYAGPVVITDASAIGTTKKFYRAITP